MRRYIALMSVLAALVAALGCQHIGGKCDCGYNPSDYPIAGPTNPHPSPMNEFAMNVDAPFPTPISVLDLMEPWCTATPAFPKLLNKINGFQYPHPSPTNDGACCLTQQK